jgi:hypothetical protein
MMSPVQRRRTVSGTLVISDEATWMPASWLFDDILSALAQGVEKLDPALAEQLRDGRTEVSVGYADVRAVSGDAYDALLATVTQLTHELAGASADTGQDRDYRSAALSAVGELRALLRTDSRHAGSEPASTGSLQINDTARWEAPQWAFDFIRDHLQGAAPGLSAVLQHNRVISLRALDREPYGQLVDAVDRLLQRYRGETPSVSWAPRVQQAFTPLVDELAELLRTDPRASHRGKSHPRPC